MPAASFPPKFEGIALADLCFRRCRRKFNTVLIPRPWGENCSFSPPSLYLDHFLLVLSGLVFPDEMSWRESAVQRGSGHTAGEPFQVGRASRFWEIRLNCCFARFRLPICLVLYFATPIF